MKWVLRSKLKEIHRQSGVTMIYVTHDQTEALTFADTVVVMYEGAVVQIGTPVELFEQPKHTFVGHFIGSPGMNVLPCGIDAGGVIFDGERIPLDVSTGRAAQEAASLELGVRPEFVRFSDDGFAVEIAKGGRSGTAPDRRSSPRRARDQDARGGGRRHPLREPPHPVRPRVHPRVPGRLDDGRGGRAVTVEAEQ